MDIAQLRERYSRAGLSEQDALADPIAQFSVWFGDATASGIREPNAMTLATADELGRPCARVVLLKSFDLHGFVLFTNYWSRKGTHLLVNPYASLNFFWNELERQVIICGTVSKLDTSLSEEYFASRPRESQVGAWTSAQSQPVADRATLEARFAALAAEYEGRPIPKPPFWGGFLVAPETIEFWQGRPGHLHDRLEYRKIEAGWSRRRLNP